MTEREPTVDRTIDPVVLEKRRGLRRMKMVATGAFLLMTALFLVSLQFEGQQLVAFVEWDYLNAFAEAAMIGALADWFAVVALFRHPLGIPIWHTAIIPRRKDEIGRNLARFVETRLLSKENLSDELSRFSPADLGRRWLATEENRRRLGEWTARAALRLLEEFDDEEMDRRVAETAERRLLDLDAPDLLADGLATLVESGRHETIVDTLLERVAEWLPSRRETVRQFVTGALSRTLKWGSSLVPDIVVEKATDRTLEALIGLFVEAAHDPEHPLRNDLEGRFSETIDRLRSDPVWRDRVDSWKEEAIASPKVREGITRLWESGKERLLEELSNRESGTARWIDNWVDRLAMRLDVDEDLRASIDERLRSVVTSVIDRYHSEIGALVERIMDTWDGERLADEMELNLGRDLQYIRLNGTVIGGIVGLLIHLLLK